MERLALQGVSLYEQKGNVQMSGAPRTILTLLVMFAGMGSARAQEGSGPWKLQPMNFDMWCQETEHLAPARCDQRSPADDAAFQSFSNKVESYEIDSLRRQARNREIMQDIVHYDPVDHPMELSAPQTDQPNRND
jgi:hypothetical protein